MLGRSSTVARGGRTVQTLFPGGACPAGCFRGSLHPLHRASPVRMPEAGKGGSQPWGSSVHWSREWGPPPAAWSEGFPPPAVASQLQLRPRRGGKGGGQGSRGAEGSLSSGSLLGWPTGQGQLGGRAPDSVVRPNPKPAQKAARPRFRLHIPWLCARWSLPYGKGVIVPCSLPNTALDEVLAGQPHHSGAALDRALNHAAYWLFKKYYTG